MANYNQIRFGHREGPGKGREYPVAASQTFARRGGKFVYLDSSGAVTIAGDCKDTLFGWAEVPKDASATNFWTSSSTAKNDKVFVIYGLEDVFEIPYYNASASVSATVVAERLGIINSGVGGIQSAQKDCTAASECLSVVDFDANENTVYVKIDPDCKQSR